eukprot:992609-Alexandrium_andersonii.AAC.1
MCIRDRSGPNGVPRKASLPRGSGPSGRAPPQRSPNQRCPDRGFAPKRRSSPQLMGSNKPAPRAPRAEE